MRKIFLIQLLVIFFISSVYSKEVKIELYGQLLSIEIGGEKNFDRNFSFNEKGLETFFRDFKNGNIDLVNSIRSLKEKRNLDDWFVIKIVDELCDELHFRNVIFLEWFALGELGYKVQVSFSGPKCYLFLASEKHLYNTVNIGKYYCANCDLGKFDKNSTLQLAKFTPYQKNSKDFSFKLNSVKEFYDEGKGLVSREFTLDGGSKFEVKFSSQVIQLLDDYPDLDMKTTFNIPMSGQSGKLIEAIKEQTAALPDSAKVNWILKFMSLNFTYSPDENNFGREKAMAPEQFVFHGKGDCEDISSFLFYALKEVLNRPLIIISYPYRNHINVGISLDINSKADLVYKGRRYFICEASVDNGFIAVGGVSK